MNKMKRKRQVRQEKILNGVPLEEHLEVVHTVQDMARVHQQEHGNSETKINEDQSEETGKRKKTKK